MSKTAVKTEKSIRPVIYRDFFTDFSMHSATGELNTKTDELAVKQSIRNLLLTDKYERPMQPTIGSGLKGLLFENYTPQTQIIIQDNIRECISKYEPRANVLDVIVVPEFDNSVTITVTFGIINKPDPVNLDIVLERMR